MTKNLCRVCFDNESTLKTFTDDLIDKYGYVLDIKIQMHTIFSKTICDKCHTKIIDFYTFKRDAITNEQRLVTFDCTATISKDTLLDDPQRTPENVKNELPVKTRRKKFDYSTSIKRRSRQVNDVPVKREENDTNNAADKSKYPCDFCERTFPKINDLARHGRITHGTLNAFKCDQCERSFNLNALLLAHKQTKHALACDQCAKEFANVAQFKLHKRTHDGERFFCYHCDATFLHELYMKRHIERKHGARPLEKRTCALCAKAVYNLDNHMKNKHETERPYRCGICDGTFSLKNNYKNHMRKMHMQRYSKKLNCLCNICGKAFGGAADLKDHLISHSNARPFKCDICNKFYKKKSHLSSHLRTHSDDRQFECPHCSKRFHFRPRLTRHLRIHTGERPYVCNICNRAFNQNNAMKSHMKIHLGEHGLAIVMPEQTNGSRIDREIVE